MCAKNAEKLGWVSKIRHNMWTLNVGELLRCKLTCFSQTKSIDKDVAKLEYLCIQKACKMVQSL